MVDAASKGGDRRWPVAVVASSGGRAARDQATPITYAVVRFLKRREGIDTFDRETRFNPLLMFD